MIYPTLDNFKQILEANGIHWFTIEYERSMTINHIILEIPLFHYLFKMRGLKKFLEREFMPAGIPLIIKRTY